MISLGKACSSQFNCYCVGLSHLTCCFTVTGLNSNHLSVFPKYPNYHLAEVIIVLTIQDGPAEEIRTGGIHLLHELHQQEGFRAQLQPQVQYLW